MTTSIWFAGDAEAAARNATAALSRRGFHVVRSFDLRTAVAGHGQCACPHHGTTQCACQYVVLLAYGSGGAPVVVTAHSSDAVAEMLVINDANAPCEPAVSKAVEAALAEAASAIQASRAISEVMTSQSQSVTSEDA
jgi:hypothetical protein